MGSSLIRCNWKYGSGDRELAESVLHDFRRDDMGLKQGYRNCGVQKTTFKRNRRGENETEKIWHTGRTCYLAKKVENKQRVSCSEEPINRNLVGTHAIFSALQQLNCVVTHLHSKMKSSQTLLFQNVRES